MIPYFESDFRYRVVPVELGRHYLAQDSSQKLLTIEEFIDEYLLGSRGQAYLAQHNIFDQIPELQRDIDTPHYCFTLPFNELHESESTEVFTQIWFGSTGSYSPLHHDPYHNILAQIVGRIVFEITIII